MRLAATVLFAALIAATLFPLSPAEAWWVRAFDFPRAQVAALLAGWFVLAFAVGLHRRAWGKLCMAAAALCFGLQAYTIYPYTLLARKQSHDSAAPQTQASIRLLTANVLQTNRETDELFRIIDETRPDVVCALETDDWWNRKLDRLAPAYPHAVRRPLSNTYGMVLHSRLPLVDPVVNFIVQSDIPSIHTKVRLRSGKLLELYCVHPRPPVPSESSESTPRDAELVLIGREVHGRPGPLVVMGDFNDVAWSDTSRLFRRLSRLLDPRIGRGLYNSFPANLPLLRFPLDHFFHSDDLRVVRFRRLRSFGSDHFPLFIELSYEPQAERHQEAPARKPGDVEAGKQKVREAK